MSSSLSTPQLRSLALFAALSDETLETFASSLSVRRFAAGQMIFREGDEARELFIVVEGEVEVVKTSPRGHQIRLSRMSAGQWFGDMSLLDVQRRFAAVRAATDAGLLVLTAVVMASSAPR